MSLLDSLPEGAVFTARQGASQVLVSSDKPPDGSPRRLMIVATCDSLEQRIRTLEEELSREQAASTTAERHEEEQRTPIGINIRGLFLALIIGILGGYLLRRKLFE